MSLLNMSLGVENFCFSLRKPCEQNQNIFGKVSLSLKLSGDFFPAALTDQITDTVDYAAFCREIADHCHNLNCASFKQFHQQLEEATKKFYPVISKAYYLITLSCHANFTRETSFAIGAGLKDDQE